MDTEYRIVKIKIDNPSKLLSYDVCKTTYRTFASRFTCYEEAAKHLDRYIRRNGKQSNVVGYLIQQHMHGELKYQWSFAPNGQLLACAYMDCDEKFEGREADKTSPIVRHQMALASAGMQQMAKLQLSNPDIYHCSHTDTLSLPIP